MRVAPARSKDFEALLQKLSSHAAVEKMIDLVRLLRSVADSARSAPELAARALEAGVVTTLFAVIQANEGKPVVIACALCALSDCWWPRTREDGAACAAITAILHANISEVAVVREACRALSELGRDASNASMLAATATAPLVAALERFIDDDVACVAAMVTITRMCKVPAAAPALFGGGAIKALLAAMRRHKEVDTFAAMGCAGLAEMSRNPPTWPLLAESGAREVLIDALQRHSGPLSGVAGPAVMALRGVSEVVGIPHELATAQAKAVLAVLGMRPYWREQYIVVSAAYTLSQTLVDMRGEDVDALPKDTVSTLFALRAATEGDAGLQRVLAGAISNLMIQSDRNKAAVVRLGGAEIAVKKWLQRGLALGDFAFLANAAGALHGVCRVPEGLTAVVAAGGLPLLVKALKDHARNPHVAHAASRTVALLAMDETTAPLLLDAGSKGAALAALVAALRAHPDSADIAMAACECTGRFCTSEDAASRIYASGLATLVFAGASRHRSNPHVARMACVAVSKLTEYPLAREHASAGSAGELVMDVLDDYLREESEEGRALAFHICKAGCTALRNLCMHPANRPALLEGGAEQLAVEAYKLCGLLVGWPCLGLLFALACEPRHCAELQAAGAGLVASRAIRSLQSEDWGEVLREVKVEEWQVVWAASGLLLRLAEAAAADEDEARLEQLGMKHRAAEALVVAAVAYCEEPRVMRAVCAAIAKLARVSSVRKDLEARIAELAVGSDSEPHADAAAAASAADTSSSKVSAYAALSAVLEME